MPKYINLERARFEAERYFKSMDGIKEDLDTLFCMLQTEDVVRVRHGQWGKSGPLLECDQCGEIYSQLGGNAGKSWNYCPSCGSKMDGDEHG